MTETREIKIDIAEMTLGDIEVITGDSTFAEKMEVLQKILVEGDIKNVRVKDLPVIRAMIEEQMSEMSNPT